MYVKLQLLSNKSDASMFIADYILTSLPGPQYIHSRNYTGPVAASFELCIPMLAASILLVGFYHMQTANMCSRGH